MNKENLRIVFMGTPEFAVESLRRLVEEQYNVVGVVTMPDKPVGRHQSTLQQSAVKQYARAKGLPVLQPVRLKDETFLAQLRALRADLQIVVAFRMLPQAVWAMPPLGTFNLHASLLPQYRGAAPINWAIINGETETGLTTFFLKQEIDTGAVIRQVKTPIADTDTAATLHDKLMRLGANLVIETVELIRNGDVQAISQEQLATNGPILHPAPKIFKDTCRIDWKNKSVKELYDFVRGLSPSPAARTLMQTADGKNLPLKVFVTSKELCKHNLMLGTVCTDGRTFLKVAAKDGFLHLDEIQAEGKKRLPVASFLCGFRNADGAIMC